MQDRAGNGKIAGILSASLPAGEIRRFSDQSRLFREAVSLFLSLFCDYALAVPAALQRHPEDGAQAGGCALGGMQGALRENGGTDWFLSRFLNFVL